MTLGGVGNVSMKPYYWTIVGLCFDILGAFLVSVEAIKLPNLKRLRERILVPAHRRLLPREILIVDGEVPLLDQQPPRPGQVEFSKAILSFLVSHLLAGILGAVGLFYIFRVLDLDPLAALHHLWTAPSVATKMFAVIPLLALLTVLLLAIGEGVHQAAIAATRVPIVILEVIETRTPDGTIGITGFTLLFLGFALQIGGTISSIRSTAP